MDGVNELEGQKRRWSEEIQCGNLRCIQVSVKHFDIFAVNTENEEKQVVFVVMEEDQTREEESHLAGISEVRAVWHTNADK